MKRGVFAVLVFCVMMCTLCTAVMAEENMMDAVIDGENADKVHLRAAPSTQASSLGLYFTGTRLICLSDRSDEWTHVVIGAEEGYIMSRYLSNNAENVTSKQPVAIVSAKGGVNLRSAPTKQSERKTTLEQGDTMIILGETASHWYYADTSAGLGYVMTDYVKMTGEVAQSDSVSQEVYAAEDAGQLYKQVLRDERSFFFTVEQMEIKLSQLRKYIDFKPWEYGDFTLVDLDLDGEMEVAVDIQGYGSLVLDDRHGIAYGYLIYLRAFKDLKTDGTFSFSSSADESGFGRIWLRDDGYEIQAMAESRWKTNASADDDDPVVYLEGQTPVTRARFDQLLLEQDQKQAVTWYDLTEAELNLQLENGAER